MDLFFHCTELYEEGNFAELFRNIVGHPDLNYDALTSQEPAFRYFVNHIDASLFHYFIEAQETRNALIATIQADARLAALCAPFLDVLQNENLVMALFGYKVPHDSEVSRFPLLFQSMIQKKIQGVRNWNLLVKSKPKWSQFLQKLRSNTLLQPCYLFSYTIQGNNPFTKPAQGTIPIIFLEPEERLADDHCFDLYQDVPAYFVVETIPHLMQLLQFNSVVQALQLPHHAIYMLNLYPHEQLKMQPPLKIEQGTTFQPISMIKRDDLEMALPSWTKAWEACLCEGIEDVKTDTPNANWLYRLSQQVLYRRDVKKYGKSRFIALSMLNNINEWHDPHKGALPDGAQLGPLVEDPQEQLLNELGRRRITRPRENKHSGGQCKKIRLAHIVPQIVNKNHAPTRLLSNLLTHHSKDFECFVISSERLVCYPMEYPIGIYESKPSLERGKEMISEFQKAGVTLFVDDHPTTYFEAAEKSLQRLKEWNIDLAVFHGPDEINELISCQTDVPVRVLFDHGTLPTHHCFDAVILSTEEAFERHREEYEKRGVKSTFLNYCIDVAMHWENRIYRLEELGLPPDSFVMTTISNHLAARLGAEMCHAIAMILQRCPKAVYAPMGRLPNYEKLMHVFSSYGVANRIFPLQYRSNAAQCVRSMQLYLNEFPFGSGLAILQAMAAGCPVVSMYDLDGVQQARYGGVYFGTDRVIKSGKTEDYVDLACRLIEDPAFYQEWSSYALERYRQFSDVETYVRSFENIIKNFITL